MPNNAVRGSVRGEVEESVVLHIDVTVDENSQIVVAGAPLEDLVQTSDEDSCLCGLGYVTGIWSWLDVPLNMRPSLLVLRSPSEPSVMIPSEPCHLVDFTAAATVSVMLSINVSSRIPFSSWETTHRVLHCWSFVTSARTARPSTNLPLLYVKVKESAEVEQSIAFKLSSTRCVLVW